jgi:hypothetical protein
MNASAQSQPRDLGLAGSVIGLLALIAAVLPQWVLPAVSPAKPAEQIATGTRHSLRDGIIARIKKSFAHDAQEQKPEAQSWRQRFSIVAISLALLAITLSVFSFIRREEKLYAGLAAALGGSAIAFQLVILLAGVAAALIVLYLFQNQLDGAIQLPVAGVGAVIFLATLGGLGLGLVSFEPAALLIGAIILLLIISFAMNFFG